MLHDGDERQLDPLKARLLADALWERGFSLPGAASAAVAVYEALAFAHSARKIELSERESGAVRSVLADHGFSGPADASVITSSVEPPDRQDELSQPETRRDAARDPAVLADSRVPDEPQPHA